MSQNVEKLIRGIFACWRGENNDVEGTEKYPDKSHGVHMDHHHLRGISVSQRVAVVARRERSLRNTLCVVHTGELDTRWRTCIRQV